MTGEFPVTSVDSVGDALTWLAKRLRLSLHKMCSYSGTNSSSLIGHATGTRRSTDLNLGPLLRLLSAVGYEMVAKPANDQAGLVLRRIGARDLMVVGADGGPLQITMAGLDDLPALLNTLATARDMTISGLVRSAGLTSLGLVGIAHGTSDNADVRIRNLLTVIEAAGCVLFIRPVHDNRRAARLALATARRG